MTRGERRPWGLIRELMFIIIIIIIIVIIIIIIIIIKDPQSALEAKVSYWYPAKLS